MNTFGGAIDFIPGGGIFAGLANAALNVGVNIGQAYAQQAIFSGGSNTTPILVGSYAPANPAAQGAVTPPPSLTTGQMVAIGGAGVAAVILLVVLLRK